MNRVAIWNGGIVPKELQGLDKDKKPITTRGNVVFNPSFDMGLLSEEVVEFYTNLALDDLVEMIDAYCDMRFVWEGILFKYGMIKYDYNNSEVLDQLILDTKAFSAIRSYYYAHEVQARECLETKFESIHKLTYLDAILETHYEFVCEANELKGTAKDEKGKTIKGKNWVDPGIRLRELLNNKGIKC